MNKNIYIDNKDINNKNLEINFNKVKHNLMDLCILSSSYLKGSTKDFLLEGINLIRNLENLYKEKKMKKGEEKQLDDVKRKLENNKYENLNNNYHLHYLGNSNNNNNIRNISGLTYMTNYYNNIN